MQIELSEYQFGSNKALNVDVLIFRGKLSIEGSLDKDDD